MPGTSAAGDGLQGGARAGGGAAHRKECALVSKREQLVLRAVGCWRSIGDKGMVTSVGKLCYS